MGSLTEKFVHGAKVGRTVIKNWSHVQQRAVRSISYTLSKSVENTAGTAMEIGLQIDATVGGTDMGVDVGFARAIASGKFQ